MGTIGWLLVAFVLGGLFWPWVMKQLEKMFKKNP